MPWYAVYHKATGQLASQGSVVADPLPEHLAAKEFAERPGRMLWNPETLDFDIPAPEPEKRVSAVEFMQLFTMEERIVIRSAARAGDNVIEDFLDMVKVAGEIGLRNPLVTQGLAYLVERELLTQARADQIAAGGE